MTGKRRDDWEKSGVSVSQRDLPDDRNKTREFCVPFKHVLDRDQYDAVGDMKKIKSPVILIAGELDDLVEPVDVKELFDNANEPKRFIIIPNIGHDYRLNDDEVKLVNERILEQLNLIRK
jgi:pimeloyl-ACP methyl ester carboxylesterase